ncbi:3'-5' exonuclease [Candidatus Pacearchaeota archaeon]|nr:3'-5' exonuclease [Candidatus Pacearchaeota archaeon]
MNIQLSKPLVFLDLETTGVSTLIDRIVEFSALKINPDDTEENITIRINPQISIPPEATAIHGIKDNDVVNQPIFKEHALMIKNFLEGCDLGGFNIKKFDLKVLEAEFKRAEVEFSKENRFILDVMTIYHKLHPRDLAAAHKEYCNKEIENHHSAEQDVRATVDIFKSQLESHKELPQNISELHDFCNERKPTHWIDDKGKFIWINNDAVINFSNHGGKLLSEMVKNESSFLNWILTKDFLPDVKKIVSEALDGKFPQK